jgi:hypothetical protein
MHRINWTIARLSLAAVATFLAIAPTLQQVAAQGIGSTN